MSDSFSQIGPSGELERYHDEFANVTPELVYESAALEAQIIHQKSEIEAGYLKIARDLSTFRRKKLYLGRGYGTFRQWAESPEIGIGYRLVHDLVRIADEAIPILVKHDAIEALPSVSNMRDLLPILADDNSEDKFIEAVYVVKDLTNKEAKAAVREIRGIEQRHDDKLPAVFSASVRRGESFHTVLINCNDGDDYYRVGTLSIKPAHWARWEDRFGRFVEYVE